AVSEAEITEEEFGEPAPRPDATEVARLRREVEALKAQLKSQQTAATDPISPMQSPSATDLENLKSLLRPKKSAEEPPEEEAKPEAAKTAATNLEIMSPHEPKPEPAQQANASPGEALPSPSHTAEQPSSYPIRMQLPKSTRTSNRASEFAADSEAITHAIEDHLLPKTNLDFERVPGAAVEPKTRLFSGKATRSLSGPIGAMVAVALLLIAGGIAAYQFGWYPKFSGKSAKSDASKSSFSPRDAATSEPSSANVEPD